MGFIPQDLERAMDVLYTHRQVCEYELGWYLIDDRGYQFARQLVVSMIQHGIIVADAEHPHPVIYFAASCADCGWRATNHVKDHREWQKFYGHTTRHLFSVGITAIHHAADGASVVSSDQPTHPFTD